MPGRIAFADVIWNEGSDNMPGLVGNKFFIPRSEIDLSACTIGADGVTLVGNIALQVGGRINEIYSTENSNSPPHHRSGHQPVTCRTGFQC